MGTAVPQQGDHARPASTKGCSENYSQRDGVQLESQPRGAASLTAAPLPRDASGSGAVTLQHASPRGSLSPGPAPSIGAAPGAAALGSRGCAVVTRIHIPATGRATRRAPSPQLWALPALLPPFPVPVGAGLAAAPERISGPAGTGSGALGENFSGAATAAAVAIQGEGPARGEGPRARSLVPPPRSSRRHEGGTARCPGPARLLGAAPASPAVAPGSCGSAATCGGAPARLGSARRGRAERRGQLDRASPEGAGRGSVPREVPPVPAHRPLLPCLELAAPHRERLGPAGTRTDLGRAAANRLDTRAPAAAGGDGSVFAAAVPLQVNTAQKERHLGTSWLGLKRDPGEPPGTNPFTLGHAGRVGRAGRGSPAPGPPAMPSRGPTLRGCRRLQVPVGVGRAAWAHGAICGCLAAATRIGPTAAPLEMVPAPFHARMGTLGRTDSPGPCPVAAEMCPEEAPAGGCRGRGQGGTGGQSAQTRQRLLPAPCPPMLGR